MRNQAAVMYAPHDIRIEERQMPQPGPKEVLVQIKAVGVCGSDMHYYEHGRIGSFIVLNPLILGHESSGVIVELGSDVTRHRVGERVAIEPGQPCGHCQECRTGRYNLCRDVHFFATPPYDGAFTNYVLAHEDFAFELPENMSDEAGALIEPLSVGIWACQKGQVTAGSRVLILAQSQKIFSADFPGQSKPFRAQPIRLQPAVLRRSSPRPPGVPQSIPLRS